MADAEDALTSLPGNISSAMFPVLTSAQQTRVFTHGKPSTVQKDEIVVELNERINKVFVVVSGQLHILQVANNQETAVAICNPGMFTGELSVLMGRRGLIRIRAAEKSELIEIDREALQSLVEADSELSSFGNQLAWGVCSWRYPKREREAWHQQAGKVQLQFRLCIRFSPNNS